MNTTTLPTQNYMATILFMRTIAIANQKGGVCKTTTAVHLSVALARRGLKVLLVDMDAQGNATTHLGVQSTGQGLLQALLSQAPLSQAVVSTAYGVHLVPGGSDLEGLDVVLYARKQATAAFSLRRALAHDRSWDFVIIDCPPELGMATASALMAADELIITVTPEGASIRGMTRLLQNFAEVREANPSARLLGVLLSKYDMRTNLSREAEEVLREAFGDRAFEPIRLHQSVAKAEAEGKPVHAYDPRSVTIKQFDRLASDVIARTGTIAKEGGAAA